MTETKPQQQGGGDKLNKRPLPLPFLTPDERREYNNLRRYGVSRHDALVAILAEPKEKACST